MEEYLCKLPSNLAQQLCWFRTANHKLPVETDVEVCRHVHLILRGKAKLMSSTSRTTQR
eukprot:gene1588-1754_t